MAKIEKKVKANPLPFWSILAIFSNFLKTVQEQTLNNLESFSTTLMVVLSLFEPFSKS